MNRNKKYYQLPSQSQSVNLNSYLLEFNYSNRNKNKRKVMTLNSIDEEENSRKRYGITIPTHRQTDTPQVRHQLIKSRQKEKYVKFHTEPSEPQISHAFPIRKIRTNQHQIFKVLAKMHYQQSKQKRLQDFSHRQPISWQSYNRKEPKHQNKPKPNLRWVKERYCVNRDRESGVFPFSCDTMPNALDSAVFVRNPVVGDSSN